MKPVVVQLITPILHQLLLQAKHHYLTLAQVKQLVALVLTPILHQLPLQAKHHRLILVQVKLVVILLITQTLHQRLLRDLQANHLYIRLLRKK